MSNSRQLAGGSLVIPSVRPLQAARAVGQLVFSFEFIFALYLFAGVIKKNPKLSWIPVDLTGASFALSILVACFLLWGRGWRIEKNLIGLLISFFLFFCWVLTSLAWSESWSYGVTKALHTTLMGFWGVVACAVIIGRDFKRLKRFSLSLVILALFLAGEVVSHLIAGTLLEEWDFASNYLGLGRLLGLSVLVLVSALLWSDLGWWKGISIGLLVGFLLSILMISGGRGPLLATLAALMVAPVCDTRFSSEALLVRRKLLLFLGFLFLVLVGFATIGNQFFFFTTIDRLLVLLEGGGGSSAQFRVWFFANAWDFWREAPFIGHGIGEFGSLLAWGDVRVYPHNIFLEILVELGLVGLILFVVAGFYSLRAFSLRALRADPILAMLFMFVVCAFWNAQVSGDLPDNRVLFALLGLFSGRAEPVSRESSEVSG
jgi:O-antigen ligase